MNIEDLKIERVAVGVSEIELNRKRVSLLFPQKHFNFKQCRYQSDSFSI